MVMSAEKWSAAAAVSSALAALLALIVTVQERNTPFDVALYSQRWGAIEEYAKASADLSTALNKAAIAVPAEVGNPDTLAKMSDAQLLAAARAARPAISAWGEYIASSSSTGVLWSLKTWGAVEKAETSGRSAYECYRRLGAYIDTDTIPKGWWNYVRSELAPGPCRDFRSAQREATFDRDARDVLRVMTDELRDEKDEFVPGVKHKTND